MKEEEKLEPCAAPERLDEAIEPAVQACIDALKAEILKALEQKPLGTRLELAAKVMREIDAWREKISLSLQLTNKVENTDEEQLFNKLCIPLIELPLRGLAFSTLVNGNIQYVGELLQRCQGPLKSRKLLHIKYFGTKTLAAVKTVLLNALGLSLDDPLPETVNSRFNTWIADQKKPAPYDEWRKYQAARRC